MKKLIIFGVLVLLTGAIVFGLYFNPEVAASIKEQIFGGDEPDLPDFAKYKINKEEFMTLRAENIAMYRGVEKDTPVDPKLRSDAIRQMERQEDDLAKSLAPQAAWTELGPNPIPNAQVGTAPTTTASGRTTAIAVHPTNANIVYVGTAQGGLYRSTNGGTKWTRMMDSADSLAIGAVAIAPSQPETIYVGTGEANFSGDSFFGVGVYRIDNASTLTPTITGPLNDNAATVDVFTGRGIGEIQVHPTDPATIFVATASGIGGIGGVANNVLPSRGIYRSTNATSASPTFAKLTGLSGNVNASVRDIIIDPLNPDLLIANSVQAGGLGGIYVSTDALAASPTFTQRAVFTSTSTNELTAEFAIQHTVGNPNPTIYAATGNLGGRVLINTDGGTTWTQQIDNNFCTPQCFYDIAIDVDPTNAANVFLGGAPALVFARSTDSGVTFTNNAATARGLHVDSHAIAVAPSSPTTIYFGSDGGIYKTIDSGTNWTSLNNSQFTATQFMSLAVHSVDPNFSIGGTQDNGTNYYDPAATWLRVDGGDGGFALIDQTDTITTVVDVYHTYFNASNLMGYAHSLDADGPYSFRGCQVAGTTVNGITCTGSVLFYAPLEQGPPVTGSLGNTIYYGTQVLYRSADTGLTHTAVSQTLPEAISAIGISPQNDNVRIVGTRFGGVFGTTTGANPLVDMDPTNVIPNNYVGRAVIDPNDVNTAYVTLNGFGLAANVYKTTTLSSFAETGIAPTWTPASSGLPAVPVNAFLVDAPDSQRLFAGTDIGVYASTDGGATWTPFGTGLPRVAVFDMAFTPAPRQVRIATHGRGLWQVPALAPTAATVSIGGRVLTPAGYGLTNAIVSLADSAGNIRTARSSSFGYYRFDQVPVGETYVVSVSSKRYNFTPQVVSLFEEITDLNFTPEP